MKDPKALFPIFFASSWLGNLLLTVLAFYLAFTHDGPLTPLVFLTVALCILAGNALPITVYILLIRWQAIELKAESAEATLRVRDALARSEEVMARLDEAEGALAKSILVARQVPDRIKASFEQLDILVEKLDTLELTSFTEALTNQSETVDSLKEPLEQLQGTVASVESALKALKKDVKGVPGSLEKVLEEVSRNEPGGEEVDVSLGERLDLVYETLESVQDSLDSLLQRMVDLQVTPTTAKGESADVEEPEVEPEAEVEEEPEEGVPEVEELEEEPQPEPEPEEEVGEAEAEPAEKAKLEKASSSQLLLSPEAGETGGEAWTDGRTRVVAHAMVGMQNRLYVRGDEPWLSWDDGQMMELVGIGEFAWSIDDLKEPIEVTILLNDEFPAEGKPIQLEPGKTIRVSPKFPQ